MKISIIHPSYGRPVLAVETATKWLARAKNQNNIEYIFSLPRIDPTWKSYVQRIQATNIRTVYSGDGNMVKQLNFGAKYCTGDLIIAVFDDFMCPGNWDLLLTEALKGKDDYVVKTDDGLRHEHINSAKLMTLPIMDRKRYNELKYIYHPAYNHFYADEELYAISERDGKLITLPILFEHLHYIVGKSKEDATNRKNNRFFQKDKAIFERRKKNNFA